MRQNGEKGKKKILEELPQLIFSSIVRSQEEHNMTMQRKYSMEKVTSYSWKQSMLSLRLKACPPNGFTNYEWVSRTSRPRSRPFFWRSILGSFLVARQNLLLIILRTRIRRRNCVKIGVLVYSIGYIEPGEYTRLMMVSGWSVATVITAKA